MGQYVLTPAVAESVVISYGISFANVRSIFAIFQTNAEAIVFEIPSKHPAYYDVLTRCRRMLSGDIYFYVADEKLLLKAT